MMKKRAKMRMIYNKVFNYFNNNNLKQIIIIEIINIFINIFY